MRKQLKWKLAAIFVAAIAISTALVGGNWTAQADHGEDHWAIVHEPSGKVWVVLTYEDEWGGSFFTVKVPEGETVVPFRSTYKNGEFTTVGRLPTPTPSAGGTGSVETVEPTAEASVEPTATPVPSTPTPTATPDPDAVTLEDLQALVDQLQLQVIDLENRLATAEAEIATLKGP